MLRYRIMRCSAGDSGTLVTRKIAWMRIFTYDKKGIDGVVFAQKSEDPF